MGNVSIEILARVITAHRFSVICYNCICTQMITDVDLILDTLEGGWDI